MFTGHVQKYGIQEDPVTLTGSKIFVASQPLGLCLQKEPETFVQSKNNLHTHFFHHKRIQ